MFFRAVVVTLLLGATAIWQLQEREFFRYASLTPLYFLIGFTYFLTLLYALILHYASQQATKYFICLYLYHLTFLYFYFFNYMGS